MIDVVVISRKNEAQDICSYELASVDDSALPGFSAGAHIDVHLPGGIGITPILCIAERLAHSGADFELHYCARSNARAAFVERLRNSPFADRVFLHFNEQAETALNAARVLADPQHNTHLYVCGPGGFMQHILGSARAQGWEEAALHREYFAAAPMDSSNDASFSVRLGSSGQVFEIPADKTVVQVL